MVQTFRFVSLPAPIFPNIRCPGCWLSRLSMRRTTPISRALAARPQRPESSTHQSGGDRQCRRDIICLFLFFSFSHFIYISFLSLFLSCNHPPPRHSYVFGIFGVEQRRFTFFSGMPCVLSPQCGILDFKPSLLTIGVLCFRRPPRRAVRRGSGCS